MGGIQPSLTIMRTIKRIIKIHQINGYVVHCLFNNGASRIIDFKALFQKWNIAEGHIAYPLVNDLTEFKKFELIDGSFVWPNIAFESEDDEGRKIIQYFDLDPIVLYENSEIDESREIQVGRMIKEARKALGLTQEELAAKSGTSKHYISRIENDKSGIELMTLKKIVEGLGKRLQISIE